MSRRASASAVKDESSGRRIARSLHMLGALTRDLLEGEVSSGRDRATFTQVVLLRWLEAGGPRRTKEIAQFLSTSAAAASQLLARLKSNGRVKRSADPRDGRAELLQATERGLAFVERHRAAVGARMDVLLAGLSPVRRKRLAEDLEATIELLLRSEAELDHLCLHCNALAAPGCLMHSHGRRCPTLADLPTH
jgi:DNA-binding MarR family transcriptional regulator